MTNGFDGSKINWEAAGNAGLGGGIIKGLGLDALKPFDDSSVLGRIGNESFQGGLNQVVGGSVSGQHMTWENSWGMFSQGAAQGAALGAIREVHYYRNELNTGLPGTIKDADAQGGVDVNVDYHKLGGAKGNVKRVFADGREAVYDFEGNLVINKLNMGTFNYINPGSVGSVMGLMKNAGHYFADMLPYFAFGNTNYDGSSINERTLPWIHR